MKWYTSILQQNRKQGSQHQIHHLSESKQRHDITILYTFTSEGSLKMKNYFEQMDYTIELVARNCVK